ncbi:MAG: PqqD family protein [Bacteroidales bacterium]
MPDLKSVYSHSSAVVTRKTGNEYILVPVANNIADMNSVFTLNETGAFIWELIDGKRCVKELIDALVEEYETDEKTASEDVFSFLAEMRKYLIIND